MDLQIMEGSVAGVKSALTAGNSSGLPAIPPIKLLKYSTCDSHGRTVKKAKIVRQDGEKGKNISGYVVHGYKGQCRTCHQCRQSLYSNKGINETKPPKERLKCSQCTRFW